MAQEDSKSSRPADRHVEEWAAREMKNVAAAYDTKIDSNAELQKTDPENYGPYLEEGEAYGTPRTKENVEKACEEMEV